MKVLFVGASGMVGSKVLIQCLAHPSVTSVVAFARRDLPAEVSDHPKIQPVIIKDFSVWPEEVLQPHADAAAMIWNMGTNSGSITADLEYPLAFAEGMAKVLEKQPSRPRFRYVHLSGKFVRQNQEEPLWFLEEARKIKGQLETKALAFAESHADTWQTFIVKPGGIATKPWMALGATLFGENWAIRVEELGAFMTYLAVSGEGEEPLTENPRIVKKGRELLALRSNAS